MRLRFAVGRGHSPLIVYALSALVAHISAGSFAKPRMPLIGMPADFTKSRDSTVISTRMSLLPPPGTPPPHLGATGALMTSLLTTWRITRQRSLECVSLAVEYDGRGLRRIGRATDERTEDERRRHYPPRDTYPRYGCRENAPMKHRSDFSLHNGFGANLQRQSDPNHLTASCGHFSITVRQLIGHVPRGNWAREPSRCTSGLANCGSGWTHNGSRRNSRK